MPLYKLPGIAGPQDVHIPDAADIAKVVGETQRAASAGWKHMELPQTLFGTVKSNAITLGAASGQFLGPESGYVWALRRLIVTGLTSATTPDIVNLYKNDRFTGPATWQFNGNSFGYTFGFGELVVKSGETLSLQNVGSLAATGTILLSGELDEVPAEKYYSGRG